MRKTFIAGTCILAFLCAPALAIASETGGDVNYNQAAGGANSAVAGNGNTGISVGAEIQGGSQNVAVGYSTQVINGAGIEADNYGALVIGGTGNTAIGTNAQTIDGSNLKAIGYGAVAGRGDNNTAIGNYAYAGGIPGLDASNSNVAIGYYANAYGGSSVAIGAGAAAYAGNSVALGAGSIATEANTVSVGSYQNERRITNLAPGYWDTDAVNMSQLRGLDSKVNRLGATAFAMSALVPMGYDPKDPTQYSAGLGSYSGKGAIAVGVFHYSRPDVMWNAAIGMSDDRWEQSARFGVTWKTGGPKKKELAPAIAPPATTTPGITDRVNRILTNDGSYVPPAASDNSAGIQARVNKIIDAEDAKSVQTVQGNSSAAVLAPASAKPAVKTEAVVRDEKPAESDSIISRVDRILADSHYAG